MTLYTGIAQSTHFTILCQNGKKLLLLANIVTINRQEMGKAVILNEIVQPSLTKIKETYKWEKRLLV